MRKVEFEIEWYALLTAAERRAAAAALPFSEGAVVAGLRCTIRYRELLVLAWAPDPGTAMPSPAVVASSLVDFRVLLFVSPRRFASFVDLVMRHRPVVVSVDVDAPETLIVTVKGQHVGRGEPRRSRAQPPPRPSVDEHLAGLPAVRGAIVWRDHRGRRGYVHWPRQRKERLAAAFERALRGEPETFADPLPNQRPGVPGQCVLMPGDAEALYLAHVANSLAIDVLATVPWRLSAAGAGDLEPLFDSRSFFGFDYRRGDFLIDASSNGDALPGAPSVSVAFLTRHRLLRASPRATIHALLEWSRDRLLHFRGGDAAQDYVDQWQYDGCPPVARILTGTRPPESYALGPGRHHVVAGCYGMVGFLKAVLRAVNIPVRLVRIRVRTGWPDPEQPGLLPFGEHAVPWFPMEDLYLSHGDDPYSRHNLRLFGTSPSGADLCLEGERFRVLFPRWAPYSDDVGRRTQDLAAERLNELLLALHCADRRDGLDHEQSRVRRALPAFTLPQLETGRLWERLDERLAQLGGCDRIASLGIGDA